MARKLMVGFGLCLLLFTILFGSSVFPAVAAVSPKVSVVDLYPHSMVRLQFANLPANVKFAVMMGDAANPTAGLITVAHVYSPDGGVFAAWIEILTDVANSPIVTVRIDNGAGLFATTSFINSSAFMVPTPVPTRTPTPVGTGGNTTPGTARAIKVLHVERGGIVTAMLTNLPANTSFLITLGVAGSHGLGGYAVGHLDTGATAGQAVTGRFEIPVLLRNEATIDLRFESSDGIVYWVNFKNVTF
jgi:hypothetical protein